MFAEGRDDSGEQTHFIQSTETGSPRALSQTGTLKQTLMAYSPVLLSLARLKPTMTLEEGLWRAVQEWQHRSNFDRMIYYEMARK